MTDKERMLSRKQPYMYRDWWLLNELSVRRERPEVNGCTYVLNVNLLGTPLKTTHISWIFSCGSLYVLLMYITKY